LFGEIRRWPFLFWFPELSQSSANKVPGNPKPCSERKDSMGDAYIEPNPITDEERAIQLGESEGTLEKEGAQTEGTGTLEADKPAQETEKPAESAAATETKEEKPEALTTEEKAEIEGQGFKFETDKKGRTYVTDSEGTRIPESRFRKIYWEGKEAQALRQENQELKEKQDLFKQLGSNEYYKIYPDEAPAGWKPEAPRQQRQAPIPANFNVLDLPVNGGTYNGYTLRDVMQVDPEEGTRMLNEWKDAQHQAIRQQEGKVTEAQRKQEADAANFLTARAKEVFGEEAAKNPTSEQSRKMLLLGQEVLAWQTATNRLNLSWEDAFTIMKHNDLIKSVKLETTMKTLQGLQKQGPASIDTAGGGASPSGWVAVESMTEKQLDKHLAGLEDKDLTKFLKEAPKSVRDKHPMMPWKTV
jgi:hypothetical protein